MRGCSFIIARGSAKLMWRIAQKTNSPEGYAIPPRPPVFALRDNTTFGQKHFFLGGNKTPALLTGMFGATALVTC